MFNDVFKRDFIKVVGMKARRKMRKMRIDPYPDTILRQGLHRKEAQETIDPMVEEAMMYSAVVGTEMISGMADIIDMVDGMVLEQSERKVEVDRAIVQLRHQLGRRDDKIMVIEEWKGNVTEHMRDIGEAQGLIWGWLLEVEQRANQLQVLLVGARREVDLLAGVVTHQSELLNIHQQLILELDQENRRKFERLERMMDPWGQTFRNLIVIDLDPEDQEADVVTLVEHE